MEQKPKRGPRVTTTTTDAAVVVASVVPEPPEPEGEPAPATSVPPPMPAPEFGRDALSALIESQAAVARGLNELTAEMAALARGGLDAAARGAGDMLSAKTFADAVKINALLAHQSFDALVGGTARLSEIGVRVAAEASRPILLQFNRDWAKAVR